MAEDTDEIWAKCLNHLVIDNLTPSFETLLETHPEVVKGLVPAKFGDSWNYWSWCECRNFKDIEFSLLYAACKLNKIDIVITLLKHGADVNLGKACGHSPLYVALRGYFSKLSNLLIQHGCETSGKGIDDTPSSMNEFKSTLDRGTHELKLKKRKKVQKWVTERKVKNIKSFLKNVEADELSNDYIEGVLPFEGWVSLKDDIDQSKQNLDANRDELARLTALIEELGSQRTAVLNKITLGELPTQATQALEVLAKSEQEIYGAFNEKISSPDWNLDLMTENDLKLTFTVLGIPHLLPPIFKQNVSPEAILKLDYLALENLRVPLLFGEKLELLYVLSLIGLKHFDRVKHKEKCAICRLDAIEDCLREQGISSDLFSKIENQVKRFDLYLLTVFPPMKLALGLTPEENTKLLTVFNTINRIHKETSL